MGLPSICCIPTFVLIFVLTSLSAMRIKEESFKVAGHVFSLRMDQEEEMWRDLDNYSPFLYQGEGERVFSLELVEDLAFKGKEALFVPDLSESFERRLDLFQVDGCRGRARGTTCSAQMGTGRGGQMGTARSAQ